MALIIILNLITKISSNNISSLVKYGTAYYTKPYDKK